MKSTTRGVARHSCDRKCDCLHTDPAPQDWGWLYQFFFEHRPKSAAERKLWKICPSQSGEPWVSYAIAAELLQMGAEAVRQKAGRLPAEYRHPSVTGLFKLSGLETITKDAA